MVQDPFPDPEYDGEEPDRSVPPAVAGTGPDASDPGEGPVQGLFVCLPSEDLDVSRFAQHGESDSMPPGPLLASVVHALTSDDGQGLAALSDDQLLGVISATRRPASCTRPRCRPPTRSLTRKRSPGDCPRRSPPWPPGRSTLS